MADHYKSIPGIVASGTVVQYRAQQMDTSADRTIKAMTNANAERPIGILQNDPADGEHADIAYEGVCKAEYGGTITEGDTLACNNTGELIQDDEVADGSAMDLHHIATALEGGADGDFRLVLLHAPVRIGKE